MDHTKIAQAAESTASISPLDHDLLWEIFVMNTDMLDTGKPEEFESSPDDSFQWSALTILHRSSQVCRLWREVILGAPSLWGRVIDLAVLKGESDEWRTEVVKRTGESPLCVKGIIPSHPCPAKTFFEQFLKNNWLRIRVLHLSVLQWPKLDTTFWSTLSRPSTRLEVFEFRANHISMNPEQALPVKPFVLFANQAPSLRRFSVEMQIPLCSTQAPWIFQLRRMSFNLPTTVPDLLTAIAAMPSLEYLSIGAHTEDIGDHLTPRLRRVVLPFLREFLIDCRVENCLAFLKCITPAKNNSISRLSILFRRSLFTHLTFGTASQAVGNYLSKYVKTSIATGIRIHLDGNFELYCRHSAPFVSVLFGAYVSVLFKFLNAFPGELFPNIGELEMENYYRDSDQDNLFDPEARSFILAHPSIQVLKTNYFVLESLLEYPRIDCFPSLHTLRLTQEGIPESVIIPFLEWRQEIGSPIRNIDCTHCQKGDLQFLDAVTGLKVLWNDNGAVYEYVCRSGHPEKLAFFRAGLNGYSLNLFS